MDLLPLLCAFICASAALGSISVRRAGWLERAVSYYRKAFLHDLDETAPVELRVKLKSAPPPEVKLEPEKWDWESVERLLTLMGASKNAAPVRNALRRALRPSAPSRRFISKKLSWKLFPSLGKDHPNNIYYDFDSSNSSEESKEKKQDISTDYEEDQDNKVLVIENPVEARLPSSMISVQLLREILEARATAARQMPNTTISTIPWNRMNKTTKAMLRSYADMNEPDEDTSASGTGAKYRRAGNAGGSGDNGGIGGGGDATAEPKPYRGGE